METSKPIQRVVIVGGGTSGWMAAAALGQHFSKFKENIELTLVESSEQGTIGVGEATIPTLRRFYHRLGLTDEQVINTTKATCKLGIEFKDWSKIGESFIHPFGIYGQGTAQVDFHHYWLRSRAAGSEHNIADYSLGVQLAKANKMAFPASKPQSQLDIFDWALHFDASLFASLMKQQAEKSGVQHIDNVIEHVSLSHQGDIKALHCIDGQIIEGDLFIDCSGFKSLLLQKTLKAGYQDWSQWLVCDSAYALQSQVAKEPLARTVSQAHQAGWCWHIPLQHRMGNGFVYSSQFTDDTSARELLIKQAPGEHLHEPRQFKFTPGRANQVWKQNCIAVGLAAGFLEPLESTSIALVQTAIERIMLSLPKPSYDTQIQNRFNDVTAAEYERVRDFIILHYHATQRDDSPMWRYCREMNIPDSLAVKLERYQSSATIVPAKWDIFGKDSWLAILNGFEIVPKQFDPKANNMPIEYLSEHLSFMRQQVKKNVTQAQSHQYFLEQLANKS